MPDPLQPGDPIEGTLASRNVEPRPSEADVVKALVEVEQATKNGSPQENSPQEIPPQIAPPAPDAVTPEPWAVGRGPVAIFIAIGAGMVLGLSLLLVRGIRRGSQELSNMAATSIHDSASGRSRNVRQRVRPAIDPAAQTEAE